MTEITVKFNLSFSRRFISSVGALAIMLCAVPELDSESVTLSTYYPAPSGVYTNMITTNNTFLARDGGALAVGTVTPVANSKVTVAGGSIAGTFGITPSYVNWNTYGVGAGGAAIYNDAGSYNGLMLVGNNSGGGGVRRVKVWDEMTINGNSITTGNATISGTASVSGALSAAQVTSNGVIQTRQGLAGCIDVTHIYPAAPPGLPGGGNAVLCAAGRYVTMTDGIYTKKTIMVLTPGAAQSGYRIDARCCNCPTGGCSGM